MKKGVASFLVVLIFIMVACSPAKEFDVGTYQPSGFSEKNVPSRPTINKTAYDYEDEPEQPSIPKPNIPSIPERKPVPQLSTPIEEYKLSVGYGLLGINETLGKYSDVFTKYEFPELLKSRNVRSSISGAASAYEQFLKLRGGRVMFTANEQDVVSDYLVYRDEEPVFEYEFVLSQGTFLDYLGEEILFLGHSYRIADVTKEDVILEGLDNGNQLVIGDGGVLLNGQKITGTDSDMTGSSFKFVSKADAIQEGNDIYIPPGGSLQEYLGDPTLLTDRFNVRYQGIIDVPHTKIEFDNDDDELELTILDPYRELNIPLAYMTEDGFRLGDEDGKLHIKEANNKDEYKIEEDDYFILSSSQLSPTNLNYRRRNNEDGRLSIAFQYEGSDGDSIELSSKQGFNLRAYYNRTASGEGEGVIRFAGRDYEFHVGHRTDGYPISVDLNGDSRISGGIVDYYIPDGVINLPSSEEFSGPANITLELLNFEGVGMRKEYATLQINPFDEFTISYTTDREVFEMGEDDEISVSPFGTHYFLFNEVDDREYKEVLIEHPLEKRLAEIVVEAR